MKRAASVVAAIAVAIACGPVEPPHDAQYVTNDCSKAKDSCNAYQQIPPATCNGAVCVQSAEMKPYLVISIPDDNLYYPGVTIGLSVSDLKATPGNHACPSGCVQIPIPSGDHGYLALNPGVGAASGIGVSFGNGSGPTSIPVQVFYYPVLKVSVAQAVGDPIILYVPREQLGQPLLPLRAKSGGASIPGPNAGNGYGWSVAFGYGNYERDIVPVDDRFPPVIDHILPGPVIDAQVAMPAVDDQATPATHQLTVTWPEQDLRGFRAYLRSRSTHRRASSRVTITEQAPGPFALNTFGISNLATANLEKVVEPPDGAAIPTFADPLAPTGVGSAVFPILPPPVIVSGTLEASEVPVEGDLVFDSTAPTTSATGGITIIPNPDPTDPQGRNAGQRALHFSTAVHTASNGRYEVLLPAGEYDIFARPTDPSVGGGSSVRKTYDSGPPRRGLTFTASVLGTLRGVVRTADGRPLSGAVVEARPAASLASSSLDPRQWPLVRSTTTDASGAYVLRVDPGQLDVAVRPVPGTGFPVTIAPPPETDASRSPLTVGEGEAIDLPPIVVPPPILVDLVLHDPADNPLAGAIVRAYFPSASAVPPSANVPPAALEIGQWMTDASGHLQMLLTPPP